MLQHFARTCLISRVTGQVGSSTLVAWQEEAERLRKSAETLGWRSFVIRHAKQHRQHANFLSSRFYLENKVAGISVLPTRPLSRVLRGDRNMNFKTILPKWILPEYFKDALVIGFVLSVTNYGLDVFLFWLRIPAAETVFNDLAVGVLGAGLSLFYLSSARTNQIYLRAKERMILTAELNQHVGSALIAIRHAASLEDASERIQKVHEATEQIERVLVDLVPTVGSADAPRSLSLED